VSRARSIAVITTSPGEGSREVHAIAVPLALARVREMDADLAAIAPGVQLLRGEGSPSPVGRNRVLSPTA
jgi:hypothetical protein